MKDRTTFNQEKIDMFVEIVRGATLVWSPEIRQNVLNLYLNGTEEYIKEEYGSEDSFEHILEDFRDQIVETCYIKYPNR